MSKSHKPLPPILQGLEFRVGLDLNYPLQPITLQFAYKGSAVLTTTWNISDTEVMIAGLQKYVELFKRKYPAPTVASLNPELMLKQIKEAGGEGK